MTKREAATSIICYWNDCRRDCPLWDHARNSCSCEFYSIAELLRIARKEYVRKSRDARCGKEYRQLMKMEWKKIGGATIL